MNDVKSRFISFKTGLLKFWLLSTIILTFFYIFIYTFFYHKSDKIDIIIVDFVLMLFSIFFIKKVSFENHKIIAVLEYILTAITLYILSLIKTENIFLPIWIVGPLVIFTLIIGPLLGLLFLFFTMILFDSIYYGRLNIYSYATINEQFILFFIIGVIFIKKLEKLKEKTFIYEKILEEENIKDNLTKIYNRGYFENKSHLLLQDAKTHHKNVLFLIMDIDHFKKINDTYGHPVGDLVLVEVVNSIKSNLDDGILFARIGGEEFAIISDDIDFDTAEKIRKSIENLKISIADGIINVTISIGGVLVKNYNYEYLYKKADENLYKAKKERNKVIIEKLKK